MANIELRQRFLGEDLVGTIDLPAAPTLSWSDRAQLDRVRSTLEGLGLNVQSVARSLSGLENELGLRLHEQSMLLDRQVDLLADIAESLRTPARVRAAERLASVGELLRRKRFVRAVSIAQEAIEDDPNNPAGFIACGWAHIGLDHLDDARALFREAAQASDGDGKSAATRQAARLALALDGPDASLALLDEVADDAREPIERGAVAYDRCVYLAELGDTEKALEHLIEAGREQPSFLFAALADPLLAAHESITRAASRELKERQSDVPTRIAEHDALLAQLTDLVKRLEAADRKLGSADRERRRQLLSKFSAVAEQHCAERQDLVTSAERTLRAEGLAAAGRDLRGVLARAETHEADLFTAAVRAAELDRAVLDFATQEDAWPTKLPDGTWTIVKKRRFGQEKQWRGAQTAQGEVQIQAIE